MRERTRPPTHRTSNTSGRVQPSVWLTGQVCARDQRRGRYLPASAAHPAKMRPSIARYLIATYSSPGGLVFDPMCGAGTTPVEAIHLGRDGIGVEYEPRWVKLARANLTHAKHQGATGFGQVVRGDARHLPDLLPGELRGLVNLIVTSPPYGASTHGNPQDRAGPCGQILRLDHRYGDDRGNLAYASPDQLADGLTRILAGCRPLLAPGAHVAVVVRPYRHRGELVDIPGMVVAAAHVAGFELIDRGIALLAGVRGGRLIRRASFFQLLRVRHAVERGDRQWLLQHEIGLVFVPAGGGT